MPPSDTQGFTEVELAAWSGILDVHSLVTRELDALIGAEQGMALVEYEVLLKLAINGGRTRMSDTWRRGAHRDLRAAEGGASGR